MHKLIARLWRIIRGPLQWRVLWLAHAKFMVGVTGIVRDDQGRVLLLRHRMWPEGRQWGLPTGYAVKGEEFGATVAREVKEETGLDVKAGRLVNLNSGYKLRVEVAYEASFVGGEITTDSFEILEARWFSPDELPSGMQESHRELILTTAP
ncbi:MULTISPECIES: NUDIX domain-containing protein [Streptomyces]|uniref:NUDIX domain-containing protein n=1 Tax=Streptomyces TaxID=1883 RepID=UPI000F7800EE|nr:MULTISPECIES: NUDIX domain-containing protein [Streptomyces]RST07411.1 NUDIX domain-containing protein [Streptomyces sp. WAC07149]GLX18801.1 NUDIX hydrolase [Streptomyces lavendulae subsp. lavendulae]GLX29277.1 NUDIX hydrolase [Streptomyces lavendulae subsp. lavendulae]